MGVLLCCFALQCLEEHSSGHKILNIYTDLYVCVSILTMACILNPFYFDSFPVIIIIKGICIEPIFRTRWEPRAFYNNTNNNHTHTHTHTHTHKEHGFACLYMLFTYGLTYKVCKKKKKELPV